MLWHLAWTGEVMWALIPRTCFHDDLKKQIAALHDELKSIKKKMELSASNDELEHSVEHISAEYDNLKAVSTNLANDLKRIDENLSKISIKVYEINGLDRKSTRLNSSHANISYAVFCLKKKKKKKNQTCQPIEQEH